MNNYFSNTDNLTKNGYSILENIYSASEVDQIVSLIEQSDTGNETFRKSTELFAIRQFLKEVPKAVEFIFNSNLKSLLNHLLGPNYFVVKSIYFDKPPSSNWYVSYHQDLTISVDKKLPIEGYGPYTVKQNQFAVQPPVDILENIVTIRIHLDDTDEGNGALKVIPGSHAKGIYRPENIDWTTEKESICSLLKGGVMVMKPLLLHSSSRTTTGKKRRVIHIEFSNHELPNELNWAERLNPSINGK